MGKKCLIGFVTVSSILIAYSFIGCKKNESSRLPLPSSTEMRGDLEVLHVSPKGQTQAVREADELVVIFDHPMAVLEPLPLEERAQILKFDPPFPGKFRWMGTKTLAFTPRERFPHATDIKLTLPSGTRSIDGYVLKQDFSWSFSTIRPRLINHYPRDKEKQQKLDTGVILVFNQPVDETKVKEFTAFTGIDTDSNERPVGFSAEHLSSDRLKEADIPYPPDNVLYLKPEEKLKPGFVYSVELRAGLRGKEGPLGMEKSAFFSFETFKLFQFMGLAGAGGHDPAEPLQFRFSNRVIYKDFIARVQFEPKVEIPDYYAEWDHGNEVLWISLPLQPEIEYTCRIAADLKDEFRNSLGKDIKIVLSTSACKPSVRMTTGHGVLEAYSDLTYPLYTLNAARVRLQAARLTKDEVISTLISDKVFWPSESFNPRPDFYQVDKPLNFSFPRNKRQIVPLNIKDILNNKYGFVLFQLDTFAEDKWNRYPKAFLQVTDLGITGKFSSDNNIIWVTELKTGLSVADADVEIRDEANALRWKGRTDKEGKVQAPGWKRLGFRSKDQWTKPRQWVFACRGNDIAFTSSEWGTDLDPYRFGISYDWNPEPEKFLGYVFTERGIYRAGETVHIKSIIRNREKGQWQIPAIKAVECEIRDPFHKVVYKERAEFDPFGSFAIDLETREDASLGSYNIAVKVPPEAPGEKEIKIFETFRVEAFRPAEFEVHLRSLKESYVFGDQYQAEVRGSYLFGGAMAGQKASWTLRLNPASYAPPGHKGYIFGNDSEFWDEEGTMAEKSRLLASAEGTLGPDGKIEIKAPLVPEKENMTVSAALEATVQSPSRRSISNRIQTFIHQGEFYIGLKPDTSFLKKGETITTQVITTNPDGSINAREKCHGQAHQARMALCAQGRRWRAVPMDLGKGRYRNRGQRGPDEKRARRSRLPTR